MNDLSLPIVSMQDRISHHEVSQLGALVKVEFRLLLKRTYPPYGVKGSVLPMFTHSPSFLTKRIDFLFLLMYLDSSLQKVRINCPPI
jgi:hypothetical protein